MPTHYRIQTGTIRRVTLYRAPGGAPFAHGIYALRMREYRFALRVPGNPVVSVHPVRGEVAADGCTFPTLRRHLQRWDNLERWEH